jgi:hypothetical protein
VITKRTTLILGAGASQPYRFPLGTELRDRLLEQSTNTLSVLDAAAVPRHEWEAVRKLLRASQFDSVDDFLEKYPEHSKLTKLIAAYWINHAESFDTLLNQGNQDHWYKALLLRVLDDDPALGGGALSIVTFNYDLSLEAYFFEVLTTRYRKTPDEARASLANLKITHVHGTLGTLEGAHGKGRMFGPMTPVQLGHAAEGILTCHESGGVDAATAARKLIAESEDVAFLGFGYSKENLARLELGKSVRPAALVHGSVFMCPEYKKTLREHIDTSKFGTCCSSPHPYPATLAVISLFPEAA